MRQRTSLTMVEKRHNVWYQGYNVFDIIKIVLGTDSRGAECSFLNTPLKQELSPVHQQAAFWLPQRAGYEAFSDQTGAGTVMRDRGRRPDMVEAAAHPVGIMHTFKSSAAGNSQMRAPRGNRRQCGHTMLRPRIVRAEAVDAMMRSGSTPCSGGPVRSVDHCGIQVTRGG